MNRTAIALTAFEQGFNCAQSTLLPFARQFELKPETSLRLAACFGGGVGQMGETCGAVCGALMAIGLRYGSGDPKDQTAREEKYAAIERFLGEFTKRHGTVVCRELLGCDLSTPEGLHYAREQHLFSSVCPVLVRSGVEITEKIIEGE